jgi:NADH dehydrogenase
MATISRFSAVASIGRLRFSGFFAWLLWLGVHLLYIIGFKHRVTTLLHWAVSFLGRGRSERVTTEQQVFGRRAMDIRPYGELPFIPTDPADGEVSGVAELEDRRRTAA